MNKKAILLAILAISQLISFGTFANGNMNNLEMGTAIYRTLDTGGGFIGDHWHAGIFNYFEFSTYFRMKIFYTENGGNSIKKEMVYNEYFTVSNYESALSNIKNQFISEFDHNGDLPYTGAYSRLITPSTRASISSTASAMALDNIGYCWVNMLESYGSWNGTIADIKKTRCDGVVEYSYEKNGVDVSNSNNISLPGDSHLDAHNDLHNFWYNSGELCPRIQAGEGHGGGASASLFSPLQSANPTASNFTTSQFSNKIQLSFKVADNASVNSFILLQVKKNSESNWHVLVDENGNEWRFKTVNLTDWNGSEQYDFFHIPWNGVYAGGKYAMGSHNFDIKISIIDQGANYSNTYYTFTGSIKPINVAITGPHILGFKEKATWSANVNYSSGSHTYAWYKSTDGGSTWGGPYGTASTFENTMLYSDLVLRCDVTDSYTAETDSDTQEVEYDDGTILPKIAIDNEILPGKTALGANYPNPFNPTTVIKYQLKDDGFVSLKIYDILGKEVAELVSKNQSAGFYNTTFDASNLASGLYIYRFRVNSFVESKKMLLTK